MFIKTKLTFYGTIYIFRYWLNSNCHRQQLPYKDSIHGNSFPQVKTMELQGEARSKYNNLLINQNKMFVHSTLDGCKQIMNDGSRSNIIFIQTALYIKHSNLLEPNSFYASLLFFLFLANRNTFLSEFETF